MPEGWQKIDNHLRKEFLFKNFTQAFGFLTQVAMLAEKHNHHPHIENMYNRVILNLTTHDAGHQVTERDIKLAEAIERCLK